MKHLRQISRIIDIVLVCVEQVITEIVPTEQTGLNRFEKDILYSDRC